MTTDNGNSIQHGSFKGSRVFSIQDLNVEVTSLDISGDGSIVVAGCSNGVVLLFRLLHSSPQIGGEIIGHIRAKGLHTNLLLTVKFTDDSKYCFAGVMKGSSEMLAIDVDLLKTGSGSSIVHSHSDPKLRGFGATSRISLQDGSLDAYRLACGRGIKNVHVWQFIPPLNCEQAASWNCIYDVASNGNTITCVGFRNGGLELLTKSAGMNMRVWDLSKYDKQQRGIKPSYDDIANSQDVKCLIADGHFAYGGTYEFAAVKIDGQKEVNRDVYELPEKCNSLTTEMEVYSAGLRRRRTMREIETVLSTDDGMHILALCADGGVMYIFGRKGISTYYMDGCVLVDSLPHNKLIELCELQRDLTLDQTWTLKMIGGLQHRHDEVVLLRAIKSTEMDGSQSVSVLIDSLSELTCEMEALKYSDGRIVHSTPAKIAEQSNKKQKRDDNTSKMLKTVERVSKFVTPDGSSLEVNERHISPSDQLLRLVSVASPSFKAEIKRPKVSAGKKSIIAESPCSNICEEVSVNNCSPIEDNQLFKSFRNNGNLTLSSTPVVPKFVESTEVFPKSETFEHVDRMMFCSSVVTDIKEVVAEWKAAIFADSCRHTEAHGVTNETKQMRSSTLEQNRLIYQLFQRISSGLVKHFKYVLNSTNSLKLKREILMYVEHFEVSATELNQRQKLELNGARLMDEIAGFARKEPSTITNHDLFVLKLKNAVLKR